MPRQSDAGHFHRFWVYIQIISNQRHVVCTTQFEGGGHEYLVGLVQAVGVPTERIGVHIENIEALSMAGPSERMEITMKALQRS